MNTKSNAKSEESRFTAAPRGFCDVVGFSPGLAWLTLACSAPVAAGRDALRFKGQTPFFSVSISCRMWDKRFLGSISRSELKSSLKLATPIL